jgi:CheY-like chemotaxis protein
MPSSGRAILVVDDNRDAADSLAMLLEIGGHQVTTAYSAPDALKRASELKPAVILLDIGLPEIDGCGWRGGCAACRSYRAYAWSR